MASKLSAMTTSIVGTATRNPTAQALKGLLMDEIQRRRLAGDTDEDLAIAFIETYAPLLNVLVLAESLADLQSLVRDLITVQRLAHPIR